MVTLVQNLQIGPTGEHMGRVVDDRLKSFAAKAVAAKVVKTKTCARKDMTLVPARSLLMEKKDKYVQTKGIGAGPDRKQDVRECQMESEANEEKSV